MFLEIEPFRTGWLPVTDGNELYYAYGDQVDVPRRDAAGVVQPARERSFAREPRRGASGFR